MPNASDILHKIPIYDLAKHYEKLETIEPRRALMAEWAWVLSLVNLDQVGSAMGRTLENIDRTAMCKAIFPTLQDLYNNENLSEAQMSACVAACAEAYPFPTKLDQGPPIGGLALDGQADLMLKALRAQWSHQDFAVALEAQNKRKIA